jgi:gentisate 1,2-dioxygenase
VRKDYEPGVLAPSQKSSSEILNAHLSELKPGSSSVRHRHTTEAYLYCVKGHGFTVVNYEGEPEQVVEWSAGTLFAPACHPAPWPGPPRPWSERPGAAP